MACHDGADAARGVVVARLGLPEAAGLAVWAVVHGVALLVVEGSLRGVAEAGQLACLAQVLGIFLAGLGLSEPAGFAARG